MTAINQAQAEQIRASRYPVCPACQRPTTTVGAKTVIDSERGTEDDAWFARCSGLKGPAGFFRGMIDDAATETPWHVNVRLGSRARIR